MQNLPSTEHQFVEALKAMPLPRPRSELIDRLNGRAPGSHSFAWAVPAALTTALAVALVVGMSLRPTLSLADVVKAVGEQQQYTVTTTFDFGSTSRTTRQYRRGSLWRSTRGYGLPDRTVVFDAKKRFVLVDSPRATPLGQVWAESELSRLLNPNIEPKIERDVVWNGRVVDRFTTDGIDRSTGEEVQIYQELIVDPKTKLPIHKVTREGDNGTRTTDYDFTAPPASVFNVSIPSGEKIYDVVAQRSQIEQRLAEDNAVAILDDDDRFYMLTPGAKDQSLFVPKTFHVVGLEEPLKLDELVLTNITHETPTERYALPIGSRFWTVSRSNDSQGNLFWPKKLLQLHEIRGRLDSARTTSQKEDPTIELHDVKVLHTGDAKFLLESFLDGRYALAG